MHSVGHSHQTSYYEEIGTSRAMSFKSAGSTIKFEDNSRISTISRRRWYQETLHLHRTIGKTHQSAGPTINDDAQKLLLYSPPLRLIALLRHGIARSADWIS